MPKRMLLAHLLIWFFSGMRPAMILHIVQRSECSVAKIAWKYFCENTGMLFHVLDQNTFTAVCLSTFGTLHRFFFCMGLFVCLQIIFVLKTEIKYFHVD